MKALSVVTWYVLMWDVHNIGWCVSYELHVVCVGCGVWVLLCMCVLFCLTAYILQVIIRKKSLLFWSCSVDDSCTLLNDDPEVYMSSNNNSEVCTCLCECVRECERVCV